MEIKCQLDATEVFIADLTACSTCFGHHYAHYQELKSIIQWLLPVVFRAVVFKLLVWCGAEGCVSGLQDAAASCKLSAPHQTNNLKTRPRNTTGSIHCIILLSSWWWAWWCPKHVEQAVRSAIKTSVSSSWHFISTHAVLFVLSSVLTRRCLISVICYASVCLVVEHERNWQIGKYKKENGRWLR